MARSVFNNKGDANHEQGAQRTEMEIPAPDTPTQAAPERPKEAPKVHPPPSGRIPSVIVGVVIAVIAGLSIWYLVRPEPLLVQGEVDATRLDIAARVDGRVADIPVARGEDVGAGAVLVRIDNPETLAKNEQALAAKVVAEAQLANINAGTRPEIIAARKAALERAQAGVILAQKTYDRVRQLAEHGNAPQARLDQATDTLHGSERAVDQAKSAYDQAVNGYTAEERQIAAANVQKAIADIKAVQSIVDQMVVYAPVAAQVYKRNVEPGEYVSPGVPLVTLIDLGDMWIHFDLREDLVTTLKVGDRFERANSGARRSPHHRRSQADRHQRRICELARHPRHRRFRPADVFDPRLPGRQGAGAAARHERLSGLAGARMRPAPKRGFLLVARREWRWLLHDRVALILIFGVPLFAFTILAAVFSHPVIRGLGVVVVDEDRSETSRAFVEQVAAAPGLSIVERAGDLASAARAIRSGDAIAAVYIPANFERDLKAERRPQVVAFYNQQFLTAAGVAAQGLSDSLAAAAGSVAPAARAAPAAARIGALVAETIVLVNPQKNYAQFLLRALLPVVVHVVVALAAGYAVGSEFRRRSVRTWLACAGGNPIVALAGKLAPLFAIFFVIMLMVPLILEGLFEISFKGDVPMVVAAASLFILGYLALGALLQLLVRDLAIGLGLTGLVVSPAFGYAGVGFPILGMNAFAQVWGAILPLRWYMAVLLGQAARGLPVHESAFPFAVLAALATLYALLALLRLRGGRQKLDPPADRARSRRRRRPRPGSAEPSPPSGGACSQSPALSFCWCWRRWSTASTTRSRT